MASSVPLAQERWSAATSLLPKSGGHDRLPQHALPLIALGALQAFPERLRARVRETGCAHEAGLPD